MTIRTFFYSVCYSCLLLPSCLEYQDVRVAKPSDFSQNFPPIIDKRSVFPSFTSLLEPVKFGDACNTEIEFKIPPVYDNNRQDRFYYLWFFDSKLISPVSIIESEARNSEPIVFTLKRKKLEELLSTKLNQDFFAKPHMVQFFVADRKYLIAENARKADDALEDSIYWIVSFSDKSC